MPQPIPHFVLDANVFMQARREFYPFDVCPGFWDALIWHSRQGSLGSIDRVADEIQRGHDDLWTWVEQQFGESRFAATDETGVIEWYAEMTRWVQAQPQFHDYARAEFASDEVADGWLAAFAKHTPGGVVVTLEKYDPVVKRRVPLPNVCRAFDVECITPYEMLRRLRVQLTWRPPADTK